MSAGADSGLSLLIGVIMVLAGAGKLRDPRPLGLTLRQLFPAVRRRATRTSGLLARGIASIEVVVGLACALLHGPAGLAAAVALLGLCIGFLFALCRALRVGAGCSCFGRLSRTSVGGRELGRAVALLAIGGTVVVLRALPPTGRPGLGLSISAAAVGAGFLVLAMVVGERLRPAAGHPANIRPRDLLGFDSGLYSTTATRLRGVPIRPAPRLTADALRAAVDVVRTAPHTSVLLARERVDGCGDARWNAANAALNPATGLISLSVPTAGGCLLVARLRDGRPRELVTVTVLAANRGYATTRFT